MKLAVFVTSLSALIRLAHAVAVQNYAVSINHEIVTISKLLRFGDFTIAKDKHLAAWNSNKVQISGSFHNEGGFYVTNTDNSNVWMSIVGGTVENSGEFAINSLSATTNPGFLIQTSEGFQNTGKMYFGVSGLTSGSRPINITSKSAWFNLGSIIFRSESASKVPFHIEGKLFDSHAIKNLGSICMRNAIWETKTSILGGGCISVGSGSFLDLALGKDEMHQTIEQTIIMESASSELKISKLDMYQIAPVIRVVGFGGKNRIYVDVRIEGTDNLKYSENRLRLTITNSTISLLDLDIGRGYDSILFKLTLSEGGTTLWYEKAVPADSRQYDCECGSEFPVPPPVPQF
ncbi:hypothetical protein METBIDRAFT_106429 [Metschnikowia bicuspidata var. bicuspidata NRRL YB-4993]|uniref:Hyphally-regulated cell wall protein N-terminal domain-containing protein n=1 Tax=Metschnikowia bicuspidata var. bicuspidata NRRL YB-4993 TaxID=869754 RepID=A0A1A0HHK9_9ASCO|nr:hypothetical protein METBIDRAFT_106429 [Metschnikowia bicuspidata var. bicuspidata NRRL YB-4993]OBA23491.1 hypothetical protein METBIDRAFT_106429 [Metschnikowia bicuspidata var. bicuspidata NRRL YB-4993]